MKILTTILLTSFLAFNVFANDAAAPAINVQGIDPQNSVDGTSFKVYGGNTNDLFEMIPATVSVMPEMDKVSAKSYRNIYIQSAGWVVSVICAKTDENGVALKKGTECEFKLNKQGPYGIDGDTYDFKPYCSAVK